MELEEWRELLEMAEAVARIGAKAIFLEARGAVQFLNLAGEELLREAKVRRAEGGKIGVEGE